MRTSKTKVLSGWGNYPRHSGQVQSPDTTEDAARGSAEAQQWIARGNGRSYGDAGIGLSETIETTRLNRFKEFDSETGRVRVEAGVLLADVIDTFLPLGFFPPVVPGTKFVTIGGMVASDVHGKNHHGAGGFGHFIDELTLVVGDGELLRCSKEQNAEVFSATIGGMGLTGTILDVTFKLNRIESGWIKQHVFVARSLAEAIDLLIASQTSTYSVAWIDCLAHGNELGRSLIYEGEHASASDVETHSGPSSAKFPPARQNRITVPKGFPQLALNRYSVRAFNEVYFRRAKSKMFAAQLVHWDTYFFPLDGINNWNRMYGANGFVQFQCVLPFATAQDALREILTQTSNSGSGSFLAVLKTLGNGAGLMSFPMPGLTLALDFPATDRTMKLVLGLDDLVAKAGGRIYLAKDAVQSKSVFETGYGPSLTKFRELRHRLGVQSRIQSKQSNRLGI